MNQAHINGIPSMRSTQELTVASSLQSDISSRLVCFEPLAFPKIDFSRLADRQERIAQLRNLVSLPPSGLLDRIIERLEGPWSPPKNRLPKQRTPEMAGNSSEPFRMAIESPISAAMCRERLQDIAAQEQRSKISPWTTVFDYKVPIVNLPSAFEGFRILHLSDIHFMSDNPRMHTEMQKVSNWIHSNGHTFNLILISGDVITKSPEDLCSNAITTLASIRESGDHAFMVYGNHDYHGLTPARISRELEKIGYFDINNRRIDISIASNKLHLIGVDDAYFGRPKPPQSVPSDGPCIVLTHNLDAIRSNFPRCVDLVLSGHTHWGEIRGISGSRIMSAWGYCKNVNKHTEGWDALDERALSYVNPGLARYYVQGALFRKPPGIAVHTLVRSTSKSIRSDMGVS